MMVKYKLRLIEPRPKSFIENEKYPELPEIYSSLLKYNGKKHTVDYFRKKVKKCGNLEVEEAVRDFGAGFEYFVCTPKKKEEDAFYIFGGLEKINENGKI